MNSYEQSILTAKAISSKKGLNIKLIEIGDISSLADYMVIATGTSSTHVKAIADEVEYQLDEAGISVSHIEGYRSNSWIFFQTRQESFTTLKDSGRTVRKLTFPILLTNKS